MPYNYLLQPGICKGTTVLKFGLSYKDDRSRILSYGKKTFVYYEIDTINPKLVEDYLKKGYLIEALLNYVALLGWNPGNNKEFFMLDDLIKEFSLEKINTVNL